MASVLDIVVRAQDQASDVLDRVGEAGGKAGQWIDENWGKVTVAAGAAGTALEAYARQQAPATEQARRLAQSLGMTEGEVRDLATGLSNVTFPLDDVLALMESGRRQGITSAEGLERYANFWDTVGDATGLAGPMLGEAGVALRTVGIAAGEESQALGAFGFITEETTSDVGEFLGILERVGPDLHAMGGDVDDAAAILGILEREFGLSGSAARREFQSAIRAADGDMGVMLDTLGISADQLGEYRDRVAASSDVIQRNADIHAQSYTPLQRLQAGVEDLMFRYGGLAEAGSMLAPVLLGLGPAMKGLTTLTKAFGKEGLITTGITKGMTLAKQAGAIAARGLGVAMRFALGPIGLIIIAITAAVAIGIWLWRNWDQVRAAIGRIWQAITGFFRDGRDRAVAFVTDLRDRAVQRVTDLRDRAVGRVTNLRDRAVAFVTSLRDQAVARVTGLRDQAVTLATSLRDRVVQFFTSLRDQALARIRGLADDVVGFFRGLPGRVVSVIGNLGRTLWGAGRSLVQGLLDGAASLLSSIGNFFLNRLPSWIRGPFKRALGISSPSREAIEWGRSIVEGIPIGVAQLADQAGREVAELLDMTDVRPHVGAPALDHAAVDGTHGTDGAALLEELRGLRRDLQGLRVDLDGEEVGRLVFARARGGAQF